MAQSRDYKNYLRRCRYRRPEVKEKIQSYNKKWVAEHPDLVKEYNRKYREKNRTQIVQKIYYYNSRSCRDPVLGDVCKYNTLIARRRYHPDLYEGVVPKDCLIRDLVKGVDRAETQMYNEDTSPNK